MAAGVFSRCFQAKTSNDEVCIISVFRIAPVYFILHSCFNILMQGFARCCQDPVMHERITKEVKQWVWSTAHGVRSTQGCGDKHYPAPSLGKYQQFFMDSLLILQDKFFQSAFLAGPTVLTPATATGALTTKSSCLRQERSVRSSMDTWPRYTTGTQTTSWSASPHTCLQVKQTHGLDFTGTVGLTIGNGRMELQRRVATCVTFVTLMVQENM